MIRQILCLLIIPFTGYCKSPFLQKGQIDKADKWKLVWCDEFRSVKTVDDNWVSENSAPSHIISSRWRQNVDVKNGSLIIRNREEKRGGRDWTSGSITCKKKFLYGYFECRMKISAASGVNNSFWFYQWNASDSSHAFEIDVVEAQYPNLIRTNVHDCGSKTDKYRKQHQEKYIAKIDNLYNSYHVYGLWWTPKKISFFFDGKLIRTIENSCCYQDANMVLGTAVMPWAGNVTGLINGTSMNVDYVRVWKYENSAR